MRKLLNCGMTLVLIFQTPFSYADTTYSYRAPDARNVQVGHFQDIFQPTTFSTTAYSFLPSESFGNTFQSILVPCTANLTACIESVEFSKDGNSWIKAEPGAEEGQRTYNRGRLLGPNNWDIQSTEIFGEDLSLGRPAGGTVRGWQISDFPHAGGNKYNVIAAISGQKDGNSKVYNLNRFDFRVVPIIRKNVNSNQECIQGSDFQEMGPQGRMNPGMCFTAIDFPEGLKVKLKVRLGSFISALSGWFDGRLYEPNIKIDKVVKSIEITGESLKVPVVGTDQIPYENIPKNIGIDSNSLAEQTRAGVGTSNISTGNEEYSLDRFNNFGKLIQEKALGIQTIWSLTSFAGNNNCISRSEVNGVVSTNATVYQSTAPTWNNFDSTLNFKVATSHLSTDGMPFKGYYSLLLTDKTASCLWGSDISKGTAVISVQSQDGTPNVAVTTFGVKENWANFTASGFTFSSPNVKAKIILKNAKSTLTCMKGKTVKNVTGINPKCPTGYKLKVS
ncbi:MAG: hypothetical protein WCJ43_00795 [Actinomycetes bacterium]